MRLTPVALVALIGTFIFAPDVYASSCHHIPGFSSEMEVRFPANRGTALLNIAYIGKVPPARAVGMALKQCLNHATALDPSVDMLATGWHRESAKSKPANDEQIDAFGPMKFISYRAKTGKIRVEDLLAGLKNK